MAPRALNKLATPTASTQGVMMKTKMVLNTLRENVRATKASPIT